MRLFPSLSKVPKGALQSSGASSSRVEEKHAPSCLGLPVTSSELPISGFQGDEDLETAVFRDLEADCGLCLQLSRGGARGVPSEVTRPEASAGKAQA
jgi:hypothetical protein